MFDYIKNKISVFKLSIEHRKDLQKIKTLQEDLKRAVQLLNDMEDMIKHNNWTHTQKKFFWINFRSDEEYRRDVFKQMLEYYSGRNKEKK